MRRRPHRMIVYEVDGDEYIAIATGGDSIQRSATGDAIWAFSLKYQVGPAWWPPRPPPTNAGPGTWWGVRFAVFSLWHGHGDEDHLAEPCTQVLEEIEEIDGKIEVFSRCEALSARNSLRDEGVLPSSAVALHPSWCVLAAVEGQRAEFALCYAPRASLGSRVVPSGTLPEGCATF